MTMALHSFFSTLTIASDDSLGNSVSIKDIPLVLDKARTPSTSLLLHYRLYGDESCDTTSADKRKTISSPTKFILRKSPTFSKRSSRNNRKKKKNEEKKDEDEKEPQKRGGRERRAVKRHNTPSSSALSALALNQLSPRSRANRKISPTTMLSPRSARWSTNYGSTAIRQKDKEDSSLCCPKRGKFSSLPSSLQAPSLATPAA